MFRAISCTAVTGALVASVFAAVPAQASAQPICASRLAPKLAKRLSARLREATRERVSTTAIALYDRKRRLGCYLAVGRHYDSASVIKVTIVATLLRTAQKRGLTSYERSLAQAAITLSDNNATSSLWRHLGRTRIQRFLNAAGMRSTRLGPGPYWGLTRITAVDQLRLLTLLTREDDVLTDKSRRYLLKLMSQVVRSQRWGTPAGASSGLKTHVKNGWLPRSTHGWRVHSLGTFDGPECDYMFVVLTHDNPSMAYGITSIEQVARVIHSSLRPEPDPREVPFPSRKKQWQYTFQPPVRPSSWFTQGVREE